MLNVGDKIKMVKPISTLALKDFNFEITSIIDDEIHMYNSEIGYCIMSEDEFGKRFVKIESVCKHIWTDWIETKSGFSYRTDNKKYVKVRKEGCEAKASCHPCDEFNLAKGIAICLQKVKDKRKVKFREKDPFLNIKSSIVYMNDIDSLDILFDSSFDDFVWAHFVAPGVYLKMKTGTDKVVGVHIDGFSKKLRLI